MGKTETINKRAKYVYLSSHHITERWKQLAEKQGTSISKFVAKRAYVKLLFSISLLLLS